MRFLCAMYTPPVELQCWDLLVGWACPETSVRASCTSEGGFLRSDTLLGTAMMKLAPLETSCTIHDSFDLYDGRKQVGGSSPEVFFANQYSN